MERNIMAKFTDAKLSQATGAFDYEIEGQGVAKLNLPAEALKLPEWAFNALHFALKTAARNATAGLMKDEPKKAFERVAQRFASWEKGEWKAAGSTGEAGEKVGTLLARALGKVLGISADDAADQISETIRGAVEAANLDPESQEADEKKKVSKIAADIRSQLRTDPAVEPVYKQLQVEEAQKRADEAAKVKPTESKLSAILKR